MRTLIIRVPDEFFAELKELAEDRDEPIILGDGKLENVRIVGDELRAEAVFDI